MSITKNVDIDIELTPSELAKVFESWDGDAQAEFFSKLAEFVGRWKHLFEMQAIAITDSDKLTNAGRDIMRVIGDYSIKP